MWKCMPIVAATAVLLFGVPAGSRAQWPPDEVRVEFRGRLLVAPVPGSKEPRVIVTAGGGLGARRFLLSFGEDKELARTAAKLDGRTVVVTGSLGGFQFEYSGGGGGSGTETVQSILDRVHVRTLRPAEDAKK
jgi:hypothetical protein